MVNTVASLLLDKQLEADQVQRVVDDTNKFIAAHQLPNFPNQCVSFQDGSPVAFVNRYFGWSALIDTFLQRRSDHTTHIHLLISNISACQAS
jgi:hypothetical protein